MSRADKVPRTMKEKILQAAVKVAESVPLHAINRAGIATRAGCAPSLVTWYLGAMDLVRCAVIDRAVETNNVKVIAGAISILGRFPQVPDALRRKALKSLAA